jgi:hypothetical protein
MSSTKYAETYSEAREQFYAACAKRGVECDEYPHPERGPGGEQLAACVARIGPTNSSRVLILNTGTHGIEGLAGSMCLVSWLNRWTAPLPADTSVVLIHLINPWGAAWERRQTEGNVDLNRNFMDFGRPLPSNPAFEILRDALIPDAVVAAGWHRALCDLAESRSLQGEGALAHAVFGGQYSDPTGVGFGGVAPTWSNSTFRSILARHTEGARSAASIDFHTGVGPFGYGTLLSTEPAGAAGLALARRWFNGPIVAMKEDLRHMPYAVRGDIGAAATEQVAGLIAATLEFGTFDVSRFMQLQIQDCWSHSYGSRGSQEDRRLREGLKNFFFPDAKDWREAAEARASEVITEALEGVANRR